MRDRAKYRAAGVPGALLCELDADLASMGVDVVVDALPGIEASYGLVQRFLSAGTDVVSANKALLAEAGPELGMLAARHGTSVHYAAAVGGSAPMIEAVTREASVGEIRSIEGVLNGTCNYILARSEQNLAFADAVAEAQARGFAEADPNEDLSGRDAARKLAILARIAFGQELRDVALEPLAADALAGVRKISPSGTVLRVVARAWRHSDRLCGEVCLVALKPDHRLARTAGDWNTLLIQRESGETIAVSGRGAGRWPTAEALMADLLELRRTRIALPASIS